MTSIWPFLAAGDVDAAVAFYIEAFGAVEESERFRSDDGSQVAVLSIDGFSVGVATESAEFRTPSPQSVGGTMVRIHLDVDDPDAVAARAIAAGAEEMFPVADQPYGVRQGRVVDPFGHHWLVSGPLKA
ncbi:VOC family protein [Gryllotalpicola ginsengisoli]|uniref:VOC family protein n=1 Tax=Gryllotalpicola ginsengisoli TaxID=444608 RepID=UPI0004051B80|nr:VOC family protein [Gryllotalpicola ginsengisoli]